jgi:hypothetical protein
MSLRCGFGFHDWILIFGSEEEALPIGKICSRCPHTEWSMSRPPQKKFLTKYLHRHHAESTLTAVYPKESPSKGVTGCNHNVGWLLRSLTEVAFGQTMGPLKTEVVFPFFDFSSLAGPFSFSGGFLNAESGRKSCTSDHRRTRNVGTRLTRPTLLSEDVIWTT